jgi:segregation and condensation protein B
MGGTSDSLLNSDWAPGDLPATPAPEPATGEPIASEPPVSPSPAPEPAPAERAPAEASAEEPLSLEALMESLLFVADEPVPVSRLAEALEVSVREVEGALNLLTARYVGRGIGLQRHRDRVQMTTAPAAGGQVQHFLGLAASSPLSRAALETLAIIAYQQPVTRPHIDAVRGVNSDSVLKNLLGKGLIEESGRSDGPGRPVLYSVTPEFLQHFGLGSLVDLPPLNLDTATAPNAAPASEHALATPILKT